MVGDGLTVLVDLGCYIGIAVIVVCGRRFTVVAVIVVIGGRRGLLLIARVLNEEGIENCGVVSIGALHFLKWGGCA